MKTFFEIDYSCYSTLTEDESKYVSEIIGFIMVYDEDDKFKGVAGKFSFSLFNLRLAHLEGFPVEELFEQEEHLNKIGDRIYDRYSNYFVRGIKEGFDDEISGNNLLVLNYIEIAANYRGKYLSAMVMKDVINRFGQDCAFLAFKIFTLQHIEYNPVDDDAKKWHTKMKLQELEQDEEQAFYKLAAYFHSLGFESIDESKIFALNLSKNNLLDEVKFQDPDGTD